MSTFEQPRPRPVTEETEKYQAFDLVTEALEYLDEYDRRDRRDGRLPGKKDEQLQESGKKDEQLLEKAESRLSSALEVDGGYSKARYLKAMVKYLRGERAKAIELFEGLLREEAADPSSGPFAREIRYNLAAAYSEGGDEESWHEAIRYFHGAMDMNEADPDSYDPELSLLAHAGLLKTYVARKEARAQSEKRDDQQIAEDSDAIRKLHLEIRKLLGRRFLGRLLQLLRLLRLQKRVDPEVAEKVEDIVNAALVSKRRKPRGSRRGLAAWIKRLLPTAGIVLLILAVILALLAIVVSVYLYGAVRQP